MQNPVKNHIGNTRDQPKNFVEQLIEARARTVNREQKKEFRKKQLVVKKIHQRKRLLFMHINPAAGKDAAVIISRLQSQFIQLVDILLVVAVCYHGGYGLYSVGKDFMAHRLLQPLLTALIAIIMLMFAWVGIKTIVSVF